MKNSISSETEKILRHKIMTAIKANQLPVTGDFWLALVFRTESELRGICRELNIAV